MASVDIHVVRVDTRVAKVDSAQAASGAGDDSGSVGGWATIARPARSLDLLTLRGGSVADIGTDTIPPGDYRGFRPSIDPFRPGVKLKTICS